MTARFDRIKDELGTAFCRHFCQDQCRGNEHNDTCWCEEASIAGAEAIEKLVSAGYVATPLPRKGNLELVKHDIIETTKTSDR